MKRPLIIIVSVIGIFLLISLSITRLMAPKVGETFSTISNALPGGYGGGGAPELGVPPAEPAYDSAGNAITDGARATVDSIAPAQQERLVIQNADLAIVVKDPKVRMAEISKLANDMGGFVVSSNIYQSYTSMGKQVPEATIVVRVPAEKLDDALAQIKKGVVEVQTENRSGQDVTNIYVDLQAQLKAKEAAHAKLLEIMDDAVKAEDVLAIYLQVQSIETEIEQLKGQIKYYEESAALSAISVRLIAEEGTQPIEVGPWKPSGAAKDAVEDLIRFVQNFAEFLIRFVIFTLPALILIAIPLLLVFLAGRAIYRRFWKPRVVVEEKEIKNEK